MGDRDGPTRPLWVRIGLWGLPNRGWAWAFFFLSLAISIGCFAYGFVDPRFFIGVIFVLSSLWYYACIKWVDRHDRWE